MKDGSFLVNLISFYDKVSHLMDKGKAMVVFEVFEGISCSTMLEKLVAHGLDWNMLC